MNNDIKKNPSRDYDKKPQTDTNTKNFGTNPQGRNEINSGNLGNQSEVDLNRSGVGGSQNSSTKTEGYSTPSANKQSQQMQKQQAQPQQSSAQRGSVGTNSPKADTNARGENAQKQTGMNQKIKKGSSDISGSQKSYAKNRGTDFNDHTNA